MPTAPAAIRRRPQGPARVAAGPGPTARVSAPAAAAEHSAEQDAVVPMAAEAHAHACKKTAAGRVTAEEVWAGPGDASLWTSPRFDPAQWFPESPDGRPGHLAKFATAVDLFNSLEASEDAPNAEQSRCLVLTNVFRTLLHWNADTFADFLALFLPKPRLAITARTLAEALQSARGLSKAQVQAFVESGFTTKLPRAQSRLAPLPPLTVSGVFETVERLMGHEEEKVKLGTKHKALRGLLARARSQAELRLVAVLSRGRRPVPSVTHSLVLRALAYAFVLSPGRTEPADPYFNSILTNPKLFFDQNDLAQHLEGDAAAGLYARMKAMEKAVRKAFAYTQSYAKIVAELFKGRDETSLVESLTQEYPVTESASQPAAPLSNVTVEDVRVWIAQCFMDHRGSHMALGRVHQHVNKEARRIGAQTMFSLEQTRSVLRKLETDKRVMVVDEDGETMIYLT